MFALSLLIFVYFIASNNKTFSLLVNNVPVAFTGIYLRVAWNRTKMMDCWIILLDLSQLDWKLLFPLAERNQLAHIVSFF